MKRIITIFISLIISVCGVSAKNWQDYVLTPESREIYPSSVHSVTGNVSHAENILLPDGQSAVLSYDGNNNPVIILDMGKDVGGYPVFNVVAKTGCPKIRVSYAEWLDFLSPEGDFTRGECTYLEPVELPVLPGNPYRFEEYNIISTGTVIAPLIQGAERWVRISLESKDTSVNIDWFRIDYTYDMSQYQGHFLSSDELLNRLWYASAYTNQLNCIENADAWTIRLGWLVPRKLEGSNDVGLTKRGEDWKDYIFDFDFKIVKNSIGWVFRAKDENNGYAWKITTKNKLIKFKRIDGSYKLLGTVNLPEKIISGSQHHIRTLLSGNNIETYLDSQLIDKTPDATFSKGKIGFCQNKGELVLIDNVNIKDTAKNALLTDDFSNDLEQWDFMRTPSYIVDSPKRDRLIWVGDMFLQNLNNYYSFNNVKYIRDSLTQLASHQNAEGFVYPTVDPSVKSRKTPLPEGDYGYYASDEYSAWFIIVLADYYLFTGDMDFIKNHYSTVKKDIEYLSKFVGKDGLFCQREKTARNYFCQSPTGKITYMNCVYYNALISASSIASSLGFTDDARIHKDISDRLKTSINTYLFNEAKGYYSYAAFDNTMGSDGNALALVTGLPTPGQADSIILQYGTGSGHGLIESFAIEGRFMYNHDSLALQRIKSTDYAVNWVDGLNDKRGTMSTTWEAMSYPPGTGWGSLSHGNTGLAHVLSGYILGIRPTSAGFKNYDAVPHICDLKWAEGEVPVPGGKITFSWSIGDNGFKEELKSPEGCTGRIGVPKLFANYKVLVNNKLVLDADGFHQASDISGAEEDSNYIYLINVKPGTYSINVSSLP